MWTDIHVYYVIDAFRMKYSQLVNKKGYMIRFLLISS